MKLSLLLSAVPAVAALDLSNADIPANSKLGNRILSKARALDGNNNDYTWVAGYSIKFDKCVTSQDYYGGYFGNNNEGNMNYDGNYNSNNNNNNDNENMNNGYYYNQADMNRDNYNGMYEQRLVHFKLCPSNSCWQCKNGADYVVDMNEFITAAVQAKLSSQEYNCEHVRQNCWCDNAYSKDVCLSNCFKNANLDYCSTNNNENEFKLENSLECTKLNVDEQAMNTYYYKNRNNGQGDNGKIQYYVGPYCSANGKKILLGVFTEETCSYPAPKGTYEALNYGAKLPHSDKSLIDSGCISCKEPTETDNQNYWDQQDTDEVTDVCETLYGDSAKCEENLDIYVYRDNTACNFIHSLKSNTISLPSSGPAISATVFACFFALTTAFLGGMSVILFNRSRRTDVSLAGNGGEIA